MAAFSTREQKACALLLLLGRPNTPDVRLDVFTGEPVYTIWGEGKMIYVPIGRIDLIRNEHKESDDSKEQEVTFEYAYDNAIHTLNIQFN